MFHIAQYFQHVKVSVRNVDIPRDDGIVELMKVILMAPLHRVPNPEYIGDCTPTPTEQGVQKIGGFKESLSNALAHAHKNGIEEVKNLCGLVHQEGVHPVIHYTTEGIYLLNRCDSRSELSVNRFFPPSILYSST